MHIVLLNGDGLPTVSMAVNCSAGSITVCLCVCLCVNQGGTDHRSMHRSTDKL